MVEADGLVVDVTEKVGHLGGKGEVVASLPQLNALQVGPGRVKTTYQAFLFPNNFYKWSGANCQLKKCKANIGLGDDLAIYFISFLLD